MEKSTFTNKIQNPNSYTLREKMDIQAEKTRYPFCAILQQMDLLSDKAASIYHWEERYVPKVSLYMQQSPRLRMLLDQVRVIDIATPEDLKMKQEIEDAKRKEYDSSQRETFDVMNEINSYQEVSFKTAPKSVILSKFLEAGNCQTDFQVPSETHSIEELAKKSIVMDESVETETMAVIYEKQGKLDKAVAIYEILLSKYPEKNSTFASRIADLKQKISLSNSVK